MKCREKNSEKTFLKIENTEAFWEELKKINVKVILISEKGVAVSDYFSKYFAEFGEYLILSNDGYIEVCCENEFNRRYEVVGTDKADISAEKLKEMKGYVENFAAEMKKLTDIMPKINVTFGNPKETLNLRELTEALKKTLSEAFKI